MNLKIDIKQQIVTRAAKGDFIAQTELYKQYSKAMYNICLRMMSNKTDAEDALQESFIHAFANLKQLKQAEAFGGWLRRIIINKCIVAGKKNFSWTDLTENFFESLENDMTDWWSSIDINLVHEEIRNLPNGCRQVFLLYALEDFSHKEIAENLNISESTSKSQYQRARQLLKDRITKKISTNGGG